MKMSGIDNRAHYRRKFERQKKLYIFSAIFITVLLLVGFTVKLLVKSGRPDGSETEPTASKITTNANTTVATTAETTTETTAAATTETTTETTTTATTAVPTTAEPGTSKVSPVTGTAGATQNETTAPPVTTGAVITPKGKHRSLVKESKAVDISYFDDAAFLGDSRQQDFVMFNGLPSSMNYSYVSIAINTVRTKKVVSYNGQKISPYDALKKIRTSKRSI